MVMSLVDEEELSMRVAVLGALKGVPGQELVSVLPQMMEILGGSTKAHAKRGVMEVLGNVPPNALCTVVPDLVAMLEQGKGRARVDALKSGFNVSCAVLRVLKKLEVRELRKLV